MTCGEENSLHGLLAGLLGGENRPVMVAVRQRPARMGEITGRLPPHCLTKAAHRASIVGAGRGAHSRVGYAL